MRVIEAFCEGCVRLQRGASRLILRVLQGLCRVDKGGRIRVSIRSIYSPRPKPL